MDLDGYSPKPMQAACEVERPADFPLPAVIDGLRNVNRHYRLRSYFVRTARARSMTASAIAAWPSAVGWKAPE